MYLHCTKVRGEFEIESEEELIDLWRKTAISMRQANVPFASHQAAQLDRCAKELEELRAALRQTTSTGCVWCDKGHTPIQSSVSDKMVHTGMRTVDDRVVCKRGQTSTAPEPRKDVLDSPAER